MAAHSRSLAWEIPRTEEPGGLQSLGSQESNMTYSVTKPPLHPCEIYWPWRLWFFTWWKSQGKLTKSVFLIPFTQTLLCTRFPEHDLLLTWLLLCKIVFEDSDSLFLGFVFGFECPNAFQSCPHCIQLVVSGSKENYFHLCLFNYWIFKIQKVFFFSITKCTFS